MARLQLSLQKGQPNTPHDKSGALGSRSPTPQATRAQGGSLAAEYTAPPHQALRCHI